MTSDGGATTLGMGGATSYLAGRLVAGRYDVLETLGEGVLISSFRARDRILNRIVTLKTLLPAYAGRADIRERLREGLGRSLGLSHPSIVRLYDVGEEASDQLLYIVEEYVRGIDLKERIRRAAPFQLMAATEVALAIATALEYAQTRGVAHGDIRPQNVLVGGVSAQSGGAESAIKLTGFGAASAQWLAIGDDPAALRRIVTYRAPEATRDMAPSASGDIYSLGVVLYELLTGELPFTGENALQIAVRHAQDPAPSPSQANSGVPPAWDGIVLTALAKRPEERYASMSAMLADLRTVQDALRFGKSLNWFPAVPGKTENTGVSAGASGASRKADLLAELPEPRVMGAADPDDARTVVGDRIVVASTQTIVPAQPTVGAMGGAQGGEDPYQNSAAVNLQSNVVLPDTSPKRAATGNTPAYTQSSGVPAGPAGRKSASAGSKAIPTREQEAPVYNQPGESTGGGSRYLTSLNLFLALLVVVGIGVLIYEASSFLKPGEDVVVPNLVGRTLTDAHAVADEQKFDLAIVDEQYRDSIPADTIYQMQPEPGRHIREGKSVSIWVSKGPPMVLVPDVHGQSLDKARATLNGSSLKAGQISYDFDPTTPKGGVIRQTPDASESHAKGSSVDLVISKGDEPLPTDNPTPDSGAAPDAVPSPDASEPAPAPTDPAPSGRPRTFEVKYKVPADNLSHHIRIDVTDRDGTRTVFDETHKAGDYLKPSIEAVGHQIHLRLFDNDVLKDERVIP